MFLFSHLLSKRVYDRLSISVVETLVIKSLVIKLKQNHNVSLLCHLLTSITDVIMSINFWQEAAASHHRWLESDVEYECCYCDVLFQSEGGLDEHLEKGHKVRREKYKTDNPYYKVSSRPKECNLCGKTIERIERHFKREHQMESEMYFMRFVFVPTSFELDFESEDTEYTGEMSSTLQKMEEIHGTEQGVPGRFAPG